MSLLLRLLLLLTRSVERRQARRRLLSFLLSALDGAKRVTWRVMQLRGENTKKHGTKR